MAISRRIILVCPIIKYSNFNLFVSLKCDKFGVYFLQKSFLEVSFNLFFVTKKMLIEICSIIGKGENPFSYNICIMFKPHQLH
jgi:hypothetical protein